MCQVRLADFETFVALSAQLNMEKEHGRQILWKQTGSWDQGYLRSHPINLAHFDCV